MTGLFIPELDELRLLLGDETGLRVARAPGGWRSQSAAELVALGVDEPALLSVKALQRLAEQRVFPCLGVGALATPKDVARAYADWFGALEHEVVVALALDGRNHLIQELEVARGGLHGAALVPRDVFHPLIRAGASAFILAHNHPSGDPGPSPEDVAMTRAVAAVGDIIGIPLLDHLVFAARGGGWTSLFELGVLDHQEKEDEQGTAHQAL